MDSETQKVTHQNIGYEWNYSLEIESVEPPVPPSRASAKTTEKFNAGGNTETFESMLSEMDKARVEIKKKVN